MALTKDALYRREYHEILKACSDFGFSDTDDVPLSAIVRSAFQAQPAEAAGVRPPLDIKAALVELKGVRDELWNKCRSPQGADEQERYKFAYRIDGAISEIEGAASRPPIDPTAGDLLIQAANTFAEHAEACPLDDCAACVANINQLKLARKVWAASQHKAASASRLGVDWGKGESWTVEQPAARASLDEPPPKIRRQTFIERQYSEALALAQIHTQVERYAGLVAALRDLEIKLRLTGERLDQVHATMGTGYNVAALRLAALVADPPQEKTENVESQEKNISR